MEVAIVRAEVLADAADRRRKGHLKPDVLAKLQEACDPTWGLVQKLMGEREVEWMRRGDLRWKEREL